MELETKIPTTRWNKTGPIELTGQVQNNIAHGIDCNCEIFCDIFSKRNDSDISIVCPLCNDYTTNTLYIKLDAFLSPLTSEPGGFADDRLRACR
jgi:hypothetical protein